MDKNYWEDFYKKHGAEKAPSPFAKYILEKGYVKKGSDLIELGCGNGRDSEFLSTQGLNVQAIDQCESEIDVLQKNRLIEKTAYITGDFTELPDGDPVDAIYSRFTLHSIDQAGEDRVFAWAYHNLRKDGYLLIEARGKENELFGLGKKVYGEDDAYVYEEHYRRFPSLDVLKKKLERLGFTIVEAEEKSGFAPYKNTDYTFMRIAARK